MERKEIEVFTELSNFAIVRMPGRSYPGCVIQGDSLSILLRAAERAVELASTTQNQELIDEIESLKDDLAARLDHYGQVIQAHGFHLPYRRR